MKSPLSRITACTGLLVIGLSGFLNAAEPASSQVLSSLLLDVDRAGDSERLVAVGERGNVIWSDDMGKQWQKAQTPSETLLTAVDFPSNKIGYAVGHDALVLKTTDSGQTWQSVYKDPEAEVPLLDVLFLNEKQGFALGAYGYVIKTIDGGASWKNTASSVPNFDEFHFNAITRLNNGTLMIAGEAGILFRSVNQGESWEALDSPYEGSFFGVEALAQENSAVAFGLRGNVFITNDNGTTWKSLNTGTQQTFFDAVVLPDDQSLMVGSAGTLAFNDSEGTQVSNQADRAVLTSITQTRDNAFIVTSDRGVRRISSEGLGTL